VSNGHEISESVEFQTAIIELKKKGGDLTLWTAEQVFYSLKKLEKVDKRLVSVEDNCRRAVCDRSSGEPIFTPRVKRWAIGLGLPGGAGLICYTVIEVAKIIASSVH
jgi:hypothetical protein